MDGAERLTEKLRLYTWPGEDLEEHEERDNGICSHSCCLSQTEAVECFVVV